MELAVFLGIGTVAMFIVMLYVNRHYRIAIWKTAIAAVLLMFSGLVGAKLMFYIESGRVGGVSFFGALFLAPIIMLFVALMLRVPTKVMLDMCAPAECIMLALLKVKCCIDGCCIGRVITKIEDSLEIRFPSQIVEMFSAFLIMSILMWMARKEKLRGSLYPWYMVIYGITRFVLNLFRETKPFLLGLPAGNFWSLISLFIGILLLIWIDKGRQNQAMMD